MDISEWEQQHNDTYFEMKDDLKKVRGVFVAYNCNIDAIRHIDENDINKLLELVDEKR